MIRLPSRQVHLDFHTSEYMPGVGSKFTTENFQKALQLGNLNSITIFAKCHHSWCYYPTKVGSPHPTMEIDLLGEEIKAAHAIGVRAPIYITVGWSATDAERHPEWVVREEDGSMNTSNFDVNATPETEKPIVSWKLMCPNGTYADHICDLTAEICENYPVDGIFYDINFGPDCWCDACLAGMKAEGLNPENPADAHTYNVLKWQRFMTRCKDIIMSAHPEATLFFNGGANPDTPEFHDWQTHFEMEDLPTAWGGYDVMPPRAKYFTNKGKDYLGMSGKFHTTWGEFGGFKAKEAIWFEAAGMLAYGARCSFGDHMHPNGEMDLNTYSNIGYGYNYVKEIEPWCYDTTETADLGLVLSNDNEVDQGAVKALLDTKYDFDIVTSFDDISKFDTIILPDSMIGSKCFL